MKQPADIFIEVLRDARHRRGLSVDELSHQTGIPRHSIERWERGGQKPRIQSAFRIAAALGYRLELVDANQ